MNVNLFVSPTLSKQTKISAGSLLTNRPAVKDNSQISTPSLKKVSFGMSRSEMSKLTVLSKFSTFLPYDLARLNISPQRYKTGLEKMRERLSKIRTDEVECKRLMNRILKAEKIEILAKNGNTPAIINLLGGRKIDGDSFVLENISSNDFEDFNLNQSLDFSIISHWVNSDLRSANPENLSNVKNLQNCLIPEHAKLSSLISAEYTDLFHADPDLHNLRVLTNSPSKPGRVPNDADLSSLTYVSGTDLSNANSNLGKVSVMIGCQSVPPNADLRSLAKSIHADISDENPYLPRHPLAERICFPMETNYGDILKAD